ncbi:MAG: hypothetical protein FJ088_00860 [Deltaproteobacteria bacterium]|nr:hypothetical protein [Deltaproteobacteria bacterium]
MKILVFDTNSAIQMLLRIICAERGIEPVFARSHQEACEMLEGERWPALLVDSENDAFLKLLGSSGKRPEKLVLLYGGETPGDEAAGGMNFRTLKKPFSEDEFFSVVESEIEEPSVKSEERVTKIPEDILREEAAKVAARVVPEIAENIIREMMEKTLREIESTDEKNA